MSMGSQPFSQGKLVWANLQARLCDSISVSSVALFLGQFFLLFRSDSRFTSIIYTSVKVLKQMKPSEVMMGKEVMKENERNWIFQTEANNLHSLPSTIFVLLNYSTLRQGTVSQRKMLDSKPECENPVVKPWLTENKKFQQF